MANSVHNKAREVFRRSKWEKGLDYSIVAFAGVYAVALSFEILRFAA
jgi:hypothetical protein